MHLASFSELRCRIWEVAWDSAYGVENSFLWMYTDDVYWYWDIFLSFNCKGHQDVFSRESQIISYLQHENKWQFQGSLGIFQLWLFRASSSFARWEGILLMETVMQWNPGVESLLLPLPSPLTTGFLYSVREFVYGTCLPLILKSSHFIHYFSALHV